MRAEPPAAHSPKPSAGPSSRFQGIACTACRKTYPDRVLGQCTACGQVLAGRFDTARFRPSSTGARSIWRFAEMMPPVSEQHRVTLGEGLTPYVSAPHLARDLDISEVYCKLEGVNPTGSFKDRVAALGVSLAREWGYEGVFTASSGNAASAVAAYAAHGGLPCVILAREHTPIAKLSQILMYGARVIPVRHLFDSIASLSEALGVVGGTLPTYRNMFVWSTWNPLLAEALKSIAYEIALQGPLPEWLLVPVAGGDLLYGIHKGFVELRDAGVIDRLPRLIAVQGAGADPTVQAIQQGLSHTPTLASAETVAGALRVTFGADHVLSVIRESRGSAVSVPDAAIIEAQQRLARREGMFCETSSATVVAALGTLRGNGTVSADASVGLVLTGFGLKDFHPVTADPTRVSGVVDLAGLPGALPQFVRS